MSHRLFRIGILGTIVAITRSFGQLPNVVLAPSPVSAIQLASLSVSSGSPLSSLAVSDPLLASSIVVVSNRSPHPVVAISASWKVKDTVGNEQRTRQRCDTFLPSTVGSVVIQPQSQLHLGPNSCLSDRPGLDLMGTLRASERDTLTRFLANAVAIAIVVDTIMFQNGEMFANDKAYFDDITERVAAAHAVASQIRSALAAGRSRQEALDSLSSAPRSEIGTRGQWIRDFSATLLHILSSRSPVPIDHKGSAVDLHVRNLERLRVPPIVIRGF